MANLAVFLVLGITGLMIIGFIAFIIWARQRDKQFDTIIKNGPKHPLTPNISRISVRTDSQVRGVGPQHNIWFFLYKLNEEKNPKEPVIIAFAEKTARLRGMKNILAGDLSKLYTELYEGKLIVQTLENTTKSEIENNLLTIKLNNKLIGSVDLEKKIIFSSEKEQIGHYTKKEFKLGMSSSEIVAAKDIFIKDKKIMSIGAAEKFIGKDEPLFEFIDTNAPIEEIFISLNIALWQIMLPIEPTNKHTF